MTTPATPLGWQDFTRDELLALVHELIEREFLSRFEECCLSARHTVACERERVASEHRSVALKAMDDAYDTWLKRSSDKRYLAYVKASAAYKRSRKAQGTAENRMMAAWTALSGFWERGRS